MLNKKTMQCTIKRIAQENTAHTKYTNKRTNSMSTSPLVAYWGDHNSKHPQIPSPTPTPTEEQYIGPASVA